jgi:hypothetical protein
MPLLVLSPKLLNFILMREFDTKFSLSHTKLFFLVILLIYLHFLLSLERNCSTRSSSLVTLDRSSNNSRLKITKRSFHLTTPALWNSLPPDLRHFSSHSNSSQPNLNSPLSSFLLLSFSKNSKPSHSLFFLHSLTV